VHILGANIITEGERHMQVLYLDPGHATVSAEAVYTETAGGYYWLDIERTEADWHRNADRWLDTHLHDHHLVDSLNARHLPYYDGSDEYDLLVLRTLDRESPTEAPATRPVAVFVTPRVVVTVRPQGEPVFENVKARLLGGKRKAPASTVALLALLVNQVVEQLLSRREIVTDLIAQWQDQLLNDGAPFADWQSLARLRSNLRRLEAVSEDQLDALSAWREQTNLPLDAAQQAHFDELDKDLQRVFDHAAVMQADIDSLVQIHYASIGQRTNEILRFLTVISTVFLPLNLIAGIFGMNFVHLPFLENQTAPWLTVGMMVILGSGLIYWSRKKHWF
jgi:magnesium transporter